MVKLSGQKFTFRLNLRHDIKLCFIIRVFLCNFVAAKTFENYVGNK